MSGKRSPKLDLMRDARRVLEPNWLRPDERLIEFAPVWKLPVLEGVPRPPWPPEQLAKRILTVVGTVLLWIVGSVVMLALLVFLAEGLSGASAGGDVPSKQKRTKGPAVVVHGHGNNSDAGRLLTPALRRRGWWVLTNRRLAFVAPTGRSYSKFWSGSGPKTKIDGRIPVDTVLEVREGRYTCEEVHRTRKTRILRRTKPAGLYRRMLLSDGSGIDLRRRHQ